MSYNSYVKIYQDAMRTGTPNKTMSFEGWRKVAVYTRYALMAVKRVYLAELEKLWET